MSDVTLLAPGVLPTPLEYDVPAAQQITPKSITASYNGTDAGGSFVPTLIIKTPNGQIVAACPIGETLAAGASADVSWFPHVAAQTSSAPAGSIETTNTGGTVTVNPTTELLIGANLTLTNPSAGVAEVEGAAPGGSLETTNTGGTVTVNPTTELLIGAGLELTNPTPGVAEVEGAGVTSVFTSDGTIYINPLSGGLGTGSVQLEMVFGPSGSPGTGPKSIYSSSGQTGNYTPSTGVEIFPSSLSDVVFCVPFMNNDLYVHIAVVTALGNPAVVHLFDPTTGAELALHALYSFSALIIEQ